MEYEEVDIPEPEYQFDYSEIPIADGFTEARQEGNWLYATTTAGVKFRHRLPNDKMLTKNDKGEYTLVDLIRR